jgi:hypothetical protein
VCVCCVCVCEQSLILNMIKMRLAFGKTSKSRAFQEHVLLPGEQREIDP